MWWKAFHIVFMVGWFSGLFYLPRLFVYHVLAEREGDRRGCERFKLMERRLYLGIMTPAMLLTWICGLGMLWSYAWSLYGRNGWLHLKLFLLLLLTGYHLLCGHWLRKFAQDQNRHGDRFYRLVNELPLLFLVAIVLLATLKPF